MKKTSDKIVAHRSDASSSLQDDSDVKLVFLTNVGQARNFAALKNQLGIRVRAIIFCTSANHDIPVKVARICTDANIAHEKIQLPGNPTFPSIRNLNQIEKIYTDIFGRLKPSEIFLCNREGHYHFAADISENRGITLSYFEEGLSSYTNAPNFAATQNKQAAASFFHHLRLYMKNSKSLIIKFLYFLIVLPIREIRHLALFPKDLANLISKSLYKSEVWIRLGEKFGHKIIGKFYQQRTAYDNVYLVFPDKNVNFPPENTHTLNLSTEYSATGEVFKTVLDGLPQAIYLSQRYLQTPDYYKVVVASIKKSMAAVNIDTILIKFHPREDTESKNWFRTALRDEEVSFCEKHEIEKYAFEELLGNRHFKTIMALSSTALIYAEKYDPEIRAIAIGSIVAKDLMASNKRVALQIKNDVECVTPFEHVTIL